jgi:DNA-binding response OmpR family regulator
MPDRKRRILCAEARQDVAELIEVMLEGKGYEVKTSQTVAATLELAQREPFDLFIVNDGYVDGESMELLEQLRQLYPTIPVLLFSLETAGQHRNTAQETTVHHYKTRTSDFISLVQTIDKLLQAD